MKALSNLHNFCCEKRAGLTGNRQTQAEILASFAKKDDSQFAQSGENDRDYEFDWSMKALILQRARHTK